MPLPMVHLAVAFAAREEIGVDHLGRYLLGAIAPDGIHMRAGWTREDKRRIHLFEEKPLMRRLSRIDAFRREIDGRADPSFASGWLSHLAADCFWSRILVQGFRQGPGRELSEDERRRLYYRETDKVDFLLYRSAPWRKVAWEALENVDPESFLDLLSAGEIDGWRRRLLRWFTELKEEPEEEPEFFTLERVCKFIEMAGEACVTGLTDSFAKLPPTLPLYIEA